MKGILLTFRPFRAEPEEAALTAPPAEETLRDIVGGDLKVVPYFHTIERDGEICACAAFCNKDGSRQGLLVNQAATILWDEALRRAGHPSLMRPDGLPAHVLAGSVAVITGDLALLRALPT